ncbi:carbohydrate-binding domain-containing protein [Niallia oryzisoli]|uniref:carbohydrate-binding domain-containing protein n=1 Tax=Niallia oryzisoli TaxID=1737571 RepID=UPI003736CF37
MKNKSNYYKAAALLLSTGLLFGCTNKSDSTNESTGTKAAAGSAAVEEVSTLLSKTVTYDQDDLYSDWKSENPTTIELKGSDAEFDSTAAVLFQENVLTIKAGGVYVISGQLDNGQIVVDAEDKNTVRLVLNGVEVTSSDGPALHVTRAEKTTISLEEGTENKLTDGANYTNVTDEEANAAIFSKDDLTINGTGKLIVTGNHNDGITGKDDLKITGGDIQIKAVDDGLIGRDLLAVKEGTLTIDAGGDGMKSSNDKDASKGNIALEGGTFNITAGNDGVQAEKTLAIADGDYTISSGGGSPETVAGNNEMMRGPGMNSAAETTATTEDAESGKGLKAAVELAIGGGTFNIDSADDAVHSNDSLLIAGGDMTIASGDDGIHGDTSVTTKGGSITITKGYEGIEGQNITIDDGTIHVTTSDDGINVGGGNDGSGMDMQSSSKSSDQMLTINGGMIYVNAQGDGLDSNGSIKMTGGTVLVNGPTNNGNGSLDYNGSFDLTGGFLIAAGSSGMVQASSEESTQNGILMTYPETQAAGTIIHLQDSDGKSIATFAPAKDYQAVYITSPELKKDSSYTLYSGGTSTGKAADGLYTDGDYKDGTKVVEFTISDSVTWLNESGVTTASTGHGGAGGFGDGDGTRPERGNMTDMFSNLDDETKAKVQSIMEQERAGTITREEAQTQLAELGVEFPGKPQ